MDEYLLKSQKNLIFEKIEKAGLEPSAFEWVWYEYDPVAEPWLRLTCHGTDFYFEFHNRRYDSHFAWFSPAYDTIVDEYGAEASWEDQLVLFCRWLEYLKREISVPDRWAELGRYEFEWQSDEPGSGDSNEQFNRQEVAAISDALQQVQAFIETSLMPPPDGMGLAEHKIEYLLGAAKRQGRKDWFHTCVGVIVTLCTTLAARPEQATELWRILKSALQDILQNAA